MGKRGGEYVKGSSGPPEKRQKAKSESRKRYLSRTNSKKNGTRGGTVRSGLCGFLCSFALGKRLQALREFVSLFDEYVFDEVESTLSEGVDGTSGANVSSSISDSLEAELSAIRARKASPCDHILLAESAVRSTMFMSVPQRRPTKVPQMSTQEPEQVEEDEISAEDSGILTDEGREEHSESTSAEVGNIDVEESDSEIGPPCFDPFRHSDGSINVYSMADRLFQGLRLQSQPQCRYLQRCLPVEQTCDANIGSILRILTPRIQELFPSENVRIPRTFSVDVKASFNDRFPRDACMKAICDLIPPVHAADLKDPQFCILVHVLQNVACISVVEKLKEFSRYNVSMVGKSDKVQSSNEKND